MIYYIVMINCGDAGDCGGGDPTLAYAWMEKFGIPDETYGYNNY
jgi:hypothetical protein